MQCYRIYFSATVNFGNIRNKALLFNEPFRTFVLSLRLSSFCSRGHRKESQNHISGYSVVLMLPYNSLI